MQQLLPVDALQPAHQPAHVGVLGVEVGRPAGDVGFNLQIQAVEGLHQLRDQQRQGQHQHQHHPQQGEQKAQQVERLARGLLSRFGKQPPQPLFQPGHGHAEEQRQNAARQNGQHQIHQLRGKGQNVRKPQQRHKKRHAHQRHQQGLFRVRSHPNVPFPERLRGFFYCIQKKPACQAAGARRSTRFTAAPGASGLNRPDTMRWPCRPQCPAPPERSAPQNARRRAGRWRRRRSCSNIGCCRG